MKLITKIYSFQLSDIEDEESAEDSRTKVAKQSDTPRISCENCPKTYKFPSGLARHMKAIHPEMLPVAATVLTEDELDKIIKETKFQIFSNKCFPPSIKIHFEESEDFQIEKELLLADLRRIYGKLVASGKVERFYAEFRTTIVDNATNYFNVEYHIAGIMSTNLCDFLHHHYKTKKEESSGPCNPVKVITQEEYHGLQNLSGYVIHQLLKKANGKRGNKLIVPLLISFLTDNIDDQPYIKMQTRGGLKAVKIECQQIFFRCEELFRQGSSKEIRKISVEAICDVALKDDIINSKFQALIKLSGINSSSEMKSFLLESMIGVFMRLRTHSLSRDYVQKYKLQVKSLKSNKHGLRKSIKKAMNKPTEEHDH